MSGLRYDRILASTALALILAVPSFAAATAQTAAGKVAAVPTETAKPEPYGPAAPPAPDALPPEISIPGTAADPAAATVAPNAEETTSAVPVDRAATPAAAPAQPAPATMQPAAASTQPAAAPAQPPGQIAAEPTPPVDPLASLDPADREIAEKVRDLLAAKVDKIFASKKERAAVEAFYQNRSLAPMWLDKGIENARAKAVIARMKAADTDGLEARDYRFPNFAELRGPDALAEAELKLTQTVLTFARHLQAGRFPHNRVSQNNIELPQLPPDMAAVLAKIADARDAGKALDEFAPPHEAYKALKTALAELRGNSGSAAEHIADGPLLKLNPKAAMEDPRVPALRKRLGMAGDAGDLKYDAKLAEAVKKFQRSLDLPVTGNLDAKTIKELNGPARGQQVDLVIANMERWRWYARDLGKSYSMVNQPDFSLKVVHDGAVVWTTRVVIGKPGQQATPLLSETMKYITINPTWNVPPSIVHNEYLPALAQDPTVLARMGLKVTYNRNGGVHIYQPPGEGNALGRIRFNFPNRFLVYQHDTPDKHLFAHDSRAYSHGCMRIQDPAKYAEVLFNIARPTEGWTAEKVKRMFGTAEQDIQLQQVPIWVHLTYQSAFVDDAGKLQVRRDVYGLDSRTIAAIKSERAVVEPPQERTKEREAVASSSGSGQRRAVQQQPRTVGFFEQLFGGGYQARPMPPRRVTR
jgi:murein L,D-transpeptidase YcbB/YkuD